MLSYNETKKIIDWILTTPMNEVRSLVHDYLKIIRANEGQLYDSIIKHGPGMQLTADQWFDLLSKFPNRILRSQLPVDQILSEKQVSKLPPVTG